MPITQAEAQAATLAFTRDYPGALELIYHFRESTGELYGHRAAEVPAEFQDAADLSADQRTIPKG